MAATVWTICQIGGDFSDGGGMGHSIEMYYMIQHGGVGGTQQRR